jgi:hypothetical protein
MSHLSFSLLNYYLCKNDFPFSKSQLLHSQLLLLHESIALSEMEIFFQSLYIVVCHGETQEQKDICCEHQTVVTGSQSLLWWVHESLPQQCPSQQNLVALLWHLGSLLLALQQQQQQLFDDGIETLEMMSLEHHHHHHQSEEFLPLAGHRHSLSLLFSPWVQDNMSLKALQLFPFSF